MTDDDKKLCDRLRAQAVQASDSHKMLAAMKTKRQTDGGYYEGIEPEQTLEWKAADAITRLSTPALSEEEARERAAIRAAISAMPDYQQIINDLGENECRWRERACEAEAKLAAMPEQGEMREALESSALALEEAAVLLANRGLGGTASIMRNHAEIARKAIQQEASHDHAR